MEKFWTLLTFFALCQPCFSQEMPVFDDPNACVIDTWSLKGVAQEQVKLVNRTSSTYLELTVYCYNPEGGKWEIYGSIMLLGYNNCNSVESPFEDKLAWFRYFAVQTKDGKRYDYYAEVRRQDLCVYIIQPGSENESGTTSPWKTRRPNRQ